MDADPASRWTLREQLKTPRMVTIVGLCFLFAIANIGHAVTPRRFGAAYIHYEEGVCFALLVLWVWGVPLVYEVRRSGWTARARKIPLVIALVTVCAFVSGFLFPMFRLWMMILYLPALALPLFLESKKPTMTS